VIRVRKRAAARVVAALLTGAVLAGCSDGGYEAKGPFRPLPEGAPPEVGPPTTQAPVPGRPAEPGSGADAGDPNVVASGLAVPTGLALLPDGSAIVGERDTGRLLRVFPDRAPARELMTVPGIDTAGDGGLLGLAVSPTYLEDGLIYAYVSTAADNRVVRFPLGGTPNPVFTGIPRGELHNGGGLLFTPEGHLLVGTGDTGNPSLAADPNSWSGKVLEIDVFGAPVGSTPIYSRGHRDVTALCQAAEGPLYGTDDSVDGADEVNLLVQGRDYGPGAVQGTAPLAEVPGAEGGLGGCAAAGNGLFLGALDGKRIHALALDGSGTVVGDPEQFLVDEYGRLRTLVLDTEGALWITTSNRDGIGVPAADDDKVLRIMPPSSAGNSPL
jgi:glucose/arabinose dehydrogenase